MLGEDYTANLLYLGFISGRIKTFLRPYLRGNVIRPNIDDKKIIEEGKVFLDTILMDFDSINSNTFFFRQQKYDLGFSSAFSLALRIFLDISSSYPENINELKNSFGSYREVLSHLNDGQTLPQKFSKSGEETFNFFNNLKKRLDSELSKKAFSS